MDLNYVHQLLQKTKSDFERIALQFSQTRSHPRPEMKYFVNKYVKSGQRILDIGCGNGHIFQLLKDKKVDYTGLDNAKGLIFEGRKKYSPLGAKFIVQDAVLKLKFKAEKFDLIFAFAFLHHIPGEDLRKKFLEKVWKVLKPGGYFICTVWNLFSRERIKYIKEYNTKGEFEGIKLDKNDTFVPWKDSGGEILVQRYYHGFTADELQKLFQESGLETIEFFYEKDGKKSDVDEAKNICIVASKIARDLIK